MLRIWFIVLLLVESKTINSIPPKYDFNGVRLKFVANHILPFDAIKLGSDGNLTHTGSNRMLYDWLGKKLNFTISYVIINDTMALKYGSVAKLMVYLIQKKIVDGASMGFIATPERKQMMDFAYFIWAEPQAMITPGPEGETRLLFAFIRPFQTKVWLFIVASMLSVIGSMSLISKMYSSAMNLGNRPLRKQTLFGYANRYILDVLNNMTNQGGTHYSVVKNRFPFMILVGIWLLAATVIVNCYSSTVISYLTLPKTKTKINSFEDLAASNEIRLIIRDDLIIGQQIMEAKTGARKILGDQIRRNPARILHQASEVINLLRTGHYAFPFMRSTGNIFIANQYELDGKCRFSMTDPLSMYEYYSMTLQKNSQFTTTFNYALIGLWETGLPLFWVKINTPQAPQCFTKVKAHTSSANQIPIQLVDLMGAFLVLAVGIVLSALAFVLENVLALLMNTNLFRQVKTGHQNIIAEQQVLSEFW